jgi:transposase-like protein
MNISLIEKMRNNSKVSRKDIECPHCNGKNIIKYGQTSRVQAYYCKDCRKKFTEKGLKNKMYTPQVITNAITYYNLGNTLEESAKIVNKRFKVKVSKSTVHSWIKEFSDICSYSKQRSQVIKRYTGDNIIHAFSFQHSGLTYNFQFHLPKLEMLGSKYPSLIQYLKNMKTRCPSDIFKENERCSQIKLDVNIKKHGMYNQACKLAGFALKACDKNKERHNKVEEFMLINDSSTIACEVPVWLWDKNLDLGVCGHIDLLQIRQGKIYVLDFKPGAGKEKESKVASQLYLYATGFSFRTKIPLQSFRCAWFDENMYYEFNPTEIKIEMKKH